MLVRTAFNHFLLFSRLPSRSRTSNGNGGLPPSMTQSVHADWLSTDRPSSCPKCPMTPDAGRVLNNNNGGIETSYASLGRMRPTSARNGQERRRPSGNTEEFHLQLGMQVLCTGELGEFPEGIRSTISSLLPSLFPAKGAHH